MTCDMNPSEIARQMFRDYIVDGHRYSVTAAFKDGSILNVCYGRDGYRNGSFFVDLDLNDPNCHKALQLAVDSFEAGLRE